MNSDLELEFGARVLVTASTMRVIAQPGDGTHRFRQSQPSRESGRFINRDLPDGDRWPGEPVPLEWEPHPGSFDPEVELNGAVTIRLRRFPFAVPEVGLVVGSTWRHEGVVADVDGRRTLAGPTRAVSMYEIALPTTSKARLTLVHPNDLTDLTPEPETAAPVRRPFSGWARP